ncbi:MAG: LysM peptidoglycan-binding domain-containing protein [Idiomarina sp.]
MKKVYLGACLTLLLSGCQMTSSWPLIGDDEFVTPGTNQSSENTNADTDAVATSDSEPAQAQPVADDAIVAVEIPTTPQEQEFLWDRIRDQLHFVAPEIPRLQAQRNWYLRNPAYMDRVGKRAEPFLHFIVEEIERRELPLELALLPIVESAFDPFAYSHGRASGIWQFIPGTAIHYGLNINWWYDGRRDVYAATHAALDYLERLHKFFDGNWLHALAAYNSGEGRVANAVRKNKRQGKPTDFWSLDLPRETRAYVPKLLALADILKHSEKYEFSFYPIANEAYLDIVTVDSQIDLAMAAEMAELDLSELHHYNSGYNRWATAPEGPHRLMLPRANASALRTQLAITNAADWLKWERHHVSSGESLLVIANKYHTTPDVIQRVNNISGSIIRAGDYLLIPVAARDLDEYSLSADARLAATQANPKGKHRVDYQVDAGDTLWDISREYDVNLRQLAKWNGMAPTDMLRPGQKLAIWLSEAPQVTPNNRAGVIRGLSYRVRQGDSLARIAGRFNVTIAEIEKWNKISRLAYLQPGQQLKLFVDVTNLNI